MNINIDTTIAKLQSLNDAMRGASPAAALCVPPLSLEDEGMSGARFHQLAMDETGMTTIEDAAVEASLEIDCDLGCEIDSACWDWIDKLLNMDASEHAVRYPDQAIDFHKLMNDAVYQRMESDSRECFEEAKQEFMREEIDDNDMEAAISDYFQYVDRADYLPSLYDLKKERGDRLCETCQEDADDWDADCDLYHITKQCSKCYHDQATK